VVVSSWKGLYSIYVCFYYAIAWKTSWKRLMYVCWTRYSVEIIVEKINIYIHIYQARIQDSTQGGALLASGSRAAPGGKGGPVRPMKLLRIRKYRTFFLNRNWLKLYHVRHDASMKYDILLMTRKALLRLQYEEQQSHTQHPWLQKVKCNRCRFFHDPERGSKDI
jgi:hypothetical protein